MRLVLTNTELVAYPTNDEEDGMANVREATTYFVEGARYTPEFQRGVWDGRVRMVKKARGKKLRYTAPIGLIGAFLDEFEDIRFEDKRRRPGVKLDLSFDPEVIPSLRDYQEKAVEEICAEAGYETGKGLCKLPTRGGKTVIAAGVFVRLGHRGLFVVNSELLLEQTVRFFKKAIQCHEEIPDGLELVGQWGSGVYEPGWITVASVQSITTHLSGRPKARKIKGKKVEPTPESIARWEEMNARVRELLASQDIIFFDECHHLEGEEWRQALVMCDAFYKIGLSATIYFHKTEGTPRGSLWILGATGAVLFELTPSDLIRAGWLCTPEITFHKIEKPSDRLVKGSWQSVYRDGIVEHPERNAKIVEICVEETRKLHARTLVTVTQIRHGNILVGLMEEAGLRVRFVTGKEKLETRRKYIAELQRREIDVLIGTVFGEAVDIPFLETVVIADGMASPVTTMQRLRNLTPVDPKTDRPILVPLKAPQVVRVHDFADTCHKTLRAHTRDRIETLMKHPEFRVNAPRGYVRGGR